MPRAIDSVTITFGLVSIPVKVFPVATHKEKISSHLLHAKCGTRLKQQLVCPKDGEVVPRNEAMRGYTDEEGDTVALTGEEVKGAQAEDSDAISVGEFVPLSAVDPVSYESAYYLVPDGKSKATRQAYGLFLEALRRSERVAIGETVSRGKENLVMLRAGEELIVMHRLRRAEGVQAERAVADSTPAKPGKAELGLAEQLISGLTHETFDPKRYQDDSKKRLKAAIASGKAARGSVAAEAAGEEAPTGKVVDLMAALKASLHRPAAEPRKAAAPARKPARRSSARPRAAARRRSHS